MTQVLLLNVGYQPLASINYRDAIDLMLREVVTPLEESGVARKVRTPSTWFEVPNVIKLTRYYNVPHIHKRWSRSEVKNRDSYTCIYCGVSRHHRDISRRDFTVDHIIPESRGGKSNFVNTRLLLLQLQPPESKQNTIGNGLEAALGTKDPQNRYACH